MRLQSALDLKQQLLAEVVEPIARLGGTSGGARARAAEALPAAARALADETELAVGARPMAAASRARADVDPQRTVAIGIARKGREHQLAVRVQRPALLASPLVQHLVAQAAGEADVRMIGRLTKRMPRVAARPGATPLAPDAAGDAQEERAAAAPRTTRWYRLTRRPMQVGASIAHVDVTAGTLGAFVRRARGDDVYVLSNNHVLANENLGRKGDAVLQRSPLDGGTPRRDRVGALHEFVRLARGKGNRVDAALSTIAAGIAYDPTTLQDLVRGRDRRLAGLGPDVLDEGDVVYKVGRTTGATKGRVTAFALDNVVIAYDMGNVRFDDQIEIEGAGVRPFSDGGDSGSLIVDDGMRAVALLFAGGDTGGRNGQGLTYANPIAAVLAAFGATLVT